MRTSVVFFLVLILTIATLIGVTHYSKPYLQPANHLDDIAKVPEKPKDVPFTAEQSIKSLQSLFRTTELNRCVIQGNNNWVQPFLDEHLGSMGLKKIATNAYVKEPNPTVLIAPNGDKHNSIVMFMFISEQVVAQKTKQGYCFVIGGPFTSRNTRLCINCEDNRLAISTANPSLRKAITLYANNDVRITADRDFLYIQPTIEEDNTSTILKLSKFALMIQKAYDEGKLHE